MSIISTNKQHHSFYSNFSNSCQVDIYLDYCIDTTFPLEVTV